jgi:hypothetical protein
MDIAHVGLTPILMASGKHVTDGCEQAMPEHIPFRLTSVEP